MALKLQPAPSLLSLHLRAMTEALIQMSVAKKMGFLFPSAPSQEIWYLTERSRLPASHQCLLSLLQVVEAKFLVSVAKRLGLPSFTQPSPTGQRLHFRHGSLRILITLVPAYMLMGQGFCVGRGLLAT